MRAAMDPAGPPPTTTALAQSFMVSVKRVHKTVVMSGDRGTAGSSIRPVVSPVSFFMNECRPPCGGRGETHSAGVFMPTLYFNISGLLP